ncbi:MAG TPA: HAD family hydrolase [Chloroflexi bacterium]|nr:HAD family hydrolase [Chloroflexota bacterium]
MANDIKDQIDAIFFDLDGTLMDTDDQAVERVARWLQRLHWPRPQRAARRLVMAVETPGNFLVTMLDVVGLDRLAMAFAGRLRHRLGRRMHDFRLMAGAREMLIDLSSRYRMAIVSTRAEAETKAFLDQHDLHDFFELLVTCESTWRLKPHPAPILHAAQQMGVAVERCAMVGDTTVDVKSARRAGAWAIAVLCGFGGRAELERAGALWILEHTSHLTSLL